MNSVFSLLLAVVFLTACAANTPQPAPTVILPTNTVLPLETTAAPPTEIPATPTAAARPTVTAWPQPTAGPTPIGGSEQIVFGLSTRQAENYRGAGIYLFNFQTQQCTQVFPEGYRLQSVSPDGRWLLVNQGNQLFLSGVLGDSVVLLTDTLVVNPGVTALWTGDGGNILWIERPGVESRLIITDARGENWQPPQAWLEHQPLMLFPSPDLTQLVWKAGICGDQTFCGSGVWVSDIPQQTSGHFETIQVPNFSALKNGYALALTQVQEQITLQVLSQPGLEVVKNLYIGDDYPTAFSFSSDGSRVAVLGQVRSDYSGKTFGSRILMFAANDWNPQQLGSVEGLNGILAWSPDDLHVAVMTTDVDNTGYRIELVRQNPVSIANQVYTEALDIQNEAFIFVSALRWIP